MKDLWIHPTYTLGGTALAQHLHVYSTPGEQRSSDDWLSSDFNDSNV